MSNKEWDVVIVGGGPAGLTTAIMCGYRNLDTLVLEGGTWGGLPARMYPDKNIPNYPGFPQGITGAHLVEQWVEHAQKSESVTMHKERVLEIDPSGQIRTEEASYRAKTIVIATGTRPRQLGVRGEAKLSKNDRGVYYYVTQKEQFRGKTALVVGGGDTAVDAVLDLQGVADTIFIAHRRDAFRAMDENVQTMEEADNIHILYHTELEEIRGNGQVKEVVLRNNQREETWTQNTDAVILAVGLVPNVDIFSDLGLNMDDRGYLLTDDKQRTNIEGVFAVGDVVQGSPLMLVVCAAHGAVAAQSVYEYIEEPYWAEGT